ncbi:hypothetical protein SMACR_04955 [Sordaria macrospora]|uniref:DNA repair protein REV1 n=2 Tax=Sordaria macrospora TaxID=5147 RepID=F7VUK0_SORMK|nr:uncharacterized protein SMAC_04955 [Sordaria macrospora k-hell]KAA8636297.1 hypothetical protein SMACR_04955 [Sordaria macrospora]WPJ57506.1 hypothetical protein SMAC4_04955 [Sordaria macrospora]CCC09196.1 unnamed protein product [Sordaria macrospora k-hell]
MVGNNLLEKNSASVRKNIENHSFTDEGGDEYGGSRFGGFADYFQNKQIKLQNRDAQLRSSAKDKPQIFKGVVVHVLGYVQPSANDLHDTLVQHGGGWLQYLAGKTMATHIIASSVPPKKIVDLANYRVVKPAWVVDSVAAGKLLPWTEYRTIEKGPKQRTIKFDAGKMLSSQPRQQTPQRYREQTENSFYTNQLKKWSSPSQPKTPFKSPSVTVNDNIEDFEDDMSVDLLQAPASSKPELLALVEPDKSSEQPPTTPPHQAHLEPSPEARPVPPEMADPGIPEPGKSEEIQPAKPLTSEEHNARLLADPNMRKASTANPDFLKQYYSESRLHHLSTWKAQLKSRMQSLAAEKGPAKKPAKRPADSRRYIMHVDFDSFFCAVSLKKAPEYRDKPAVVAHGNGSGSEIASCNYPARKFGVKNGMWMKRALALCPDLKILPYDFPGYEAASQQFYDAILEMGGVVQSVSIDEALIDVTDIVMAEAGSKRVGISEGSIWREQEKVDRMASKLRERIKETTDCHVSVGIGGNILLAKVALRKAKPAGQYQIKPEEVLDFLGELKVEDLPGVAYSIGAKLEELGIKFVKDIRQTSKERLVSALGPKTGEKLWEYSRGIDRAEVGEQPIRKSVSADVNWGIRFVNQDEAEEFVRNLSKELERRLLNEGVKGKHLTMKIMRRAADAPLDPPKHLGHGKCDTFNKSVSFGVATNSGEVIGKEAVAILRSYKFSPGDLRGLGVQMTKLEPLKPSAAPQGSQKKLSFGAAATSSAKKRKAEAIEDDDPQSPGKPRSSTEHDEKDPISADPITPQKPKPHPALHLARAGEADVKAKTPLNIRGTQFIMPSQLDPSVLAELPEDIRLKIQEQMKTQLVKRTSFVPPQPVSRKALPNREEIPPDIDLEVFNALPPEMKAEVLASYRRNTAQAGPSRQPQPRGGGGGGQTLLLQSPRKDRIINRPVDRLRTPTKRNRGRPPAYLKEKERDLRAGLRQASLITARPPNQGINESRQPSAKIEIDLPPLDPELLSELPEDVRREVIEDHARQRRQLKRQAQETAAAQQQQEHSRHVNLIAVDVESAKHYLRRRQQSVNNNPQFPNQHNPNQPHDDRQLLPAGRHHPLFGPPPNWGRTNRDPRRIHWPGPPAKATLNSAAVPEGGTMKVTDAAAVRNMIRSWYVSTDSQGGPSKVDMEVLEEYLYKVVTLERNMEKVRGLVKWLEWCVEGGEQDDSGGNGDDKLDGGVDGVGNAEEANGERGGDGGDGGNDAEDDGMQQGISEKRKGKMAAKANYTWKEAVEVIKASVQEAMKERGLGKMTFE